MTAHEDRLRIRPDIGWGPITQTLNVKGVAVWSFVRNAVNFDAVPVFFGKVDSNAGPCGWTDAKVSRIDCVHLRKQVHRRKVDVHVHAMCEVVAKPTELFCFEIRRYTNN